MLQYTYRSKGGTRIERRHRRGQKRPFLLYPKLLPMCPHTTQTTLLLYWQVASKVGESSSAPPQRPKASVFVLTTRYYYM